MGLKQPQEYQTNETLNGMLCELVHTVLSDPQLDGTGLPVDTFKRGIKSKKNAKQACLESGCLC